jgi:Zn-dependent protease with chaperone function
VLRANYIDGRTTRVRRVDLSSAGEDLIVSGEDIALRVPFRDITVDEQLGRAPRRLRWKDGAFCEVHDLDALDALLSSMGHRGGWLERLQSRPAYVLCACLACVALAIGAYRWGLPWAAAQGADRLPPAIANTLSAQALKVLDGEILMPSKIAPERQETLTAKFRALRLPGGGTPTSSLLFRESRQLGANAFTLPDGTIIVLDELITVIGDDQQILAVFAHELGHAHARHGLQMLLQSSAVGAFLAFYVGDVSQLLALAPAAVVQARYSQNFEQQADDYASALLLQNRMSPGLLADALRKLAQSHPSSGTGGYLSSHPSTAARIRRLRLLGASFSAN